MQSRILPIAAAILLLASSAAAAPDLATCAAAPASADCAALAVPDETSAAALEVVCGMQNNLHNIAACSTSQVCRDPFQKAALGAWCDPFSLLVSACRDVAQVSGAAAVPAQCGDYVKLCGAGAVAPQCAVAASLPGTGYVNTTYAQTLINSMCSDMMMIGCNCTTANSSVINPGCNTLSVFAEMCKDMPGMRQCPNTWTFMCKNISSSCYCARGTTCVAYTGVPANATAGNGTASPVMTAPPLPAEVNACLFNASAPGCEGVEYPNKTAIYWLNKMCASAKPGQMAACTAWKVCNASTTEAGYLGKWCDPFSLYSSMCVDMKEVYPAMIPPGCEDYKALCRKGSMVAQCQTKAPSTLPAYVNTTTAQFLINDMCHTMDMLGCNCTSANATTMSPNCDTLTIFSEMCKDMPGMRQCPTWKLMCNSSSVSDSCFCRKGATCSSFVGFPKAAANSTMGNSTTGGNMTMPTGTENGTKSGAHEWARAGREGGVLVALVAAVAAALVV